MTCKNDVEEVLHRDSENILAAYLLRLFEISRSIPIVNNNLTTSSWIGCSVVIIKKTTYFGGVHY